MEELEILEQLKSVNPRDSHAVTLLIAAVLMQAGATESAVAVQLKETQEAAANAESKAAAVEKKFNALQKRFDEMLDTVQKYHDSALLQISDVSAVAGKNTANIAKLAAELVPSLGLE